MKPNCLDLHKALPNRVVLCEYLISHPMQVVFDDRTETYFAYSSVTNLIYYQKPSNKKLDGIYVAHGLMQIARAWDLIK